MNITFRKFYSLITAFSFIFNNAFEIIPPINNPKSEIITITNAKTYASF